MTEGQITDAISIRVQLHDLEQDLSNAVHLLYGILVMILSPMPNETESPIARVVRFKLLQLPQGCRVGRRLIELDDQFGGLLEGKGIWLKRWVYEPRGKEND